jgi:hypothetical protein
MPDEPAEWTQVELTSPRSAVGQRWIAAILVMTGVVGGVLSFFAEPEGWVVVSVGVVCLLICVTGISLWFNAGMNADATVGLLETGTRVTLPVIATEEIADDGVIHRLSLRLPGDAIVQHQCGQGQCVDAGREAPHSQVPAILDPVAKSWGVVHGRLGG